MHLSFDVGIKNLAYCVWDNENIRQWDVVDISGKNIHETSKNIIMLLDELELGDEYTVLIENQPVYKNPTMKTIQIVIYTYFQMLEVHGVSKIKIVFCAASQKNKFLKSKGYVVTDYKSAKKSSIEYVKSLVTLPDVKKKDDLCDAYLQILAYTNAL